MSNERDDAGVYHADKSLRSMIRLRERKKEATKRASNSDLQSPLSDKAMGRAEAFTTAVKDAERMLDRPECHRCHVKMDLVRDARFSTEWAWDCRHCRNRRKIVFQEDQADA